MELLLGLVVRVGLLVAAWKLYRLTRQWKRAGQLRWRRRVGLLFFLAPVLTWVAGLVLPEALLLPFQALRAVDQGLTAAVAALSGQVSQRAEGVWRVALLPLTSALVYGGAGLLVGWPLDRRAARRAAAAGGEESASTAEG